MTYCRYLPILRYPYHASRVTSFSLVLLCFVFCEVLNSEFSLVIYIYLAMAFLCVVAAVLLFSSLLLYPACYGMARQ